MASLPESRDDCGGRAGGARVLAAWGAHAGRVRAPQGGALRPPGLLLLARTRWKAQVQQQPCRPSRAAVCGRLLPSGQRCSLANGRSALQRRCSVVAAARHWAPACWRRRPELLARALASARPVAWLLAAGRPAAGGAACPARRPLCRRLSSRAHAPVRSLLVSPPRWRPWPRRASTPSGTAMPR